jgi:hypothetical protein
MTYRVIPPDQVKIKARYRKDLGDLSSLTAPLILGIGALHLRYGDDLNGGQLARKLAQAGTPLQLVTKAKVRREIAPSTLWRAVAEFAVDVYNRGLRKNPLPPLR